MLRILTSTLGVVLLCGFCLAGQAVAQQETDLVDEIFAEAKRLRTEREANVRGLIGTWSHTRQLKDGTEVRLGLVFQDNNNALLTVAKTPPNDEPTIQRDEGTYRASGDKIRIDYDDDTTEVLTYTVNQSQLTILNDGEIFAEFEQIQSGTNPLAFGNWHVDVPTSSGRFKVDLTLHVNGDYKLVIDENNVQYRQTHQGSFAFKNGNLVLRTKGTESKGPADLSKDELTLEIGGKQFVFTRNGTGSRVIQLK